MCGSDGVSQKKHPNKEVAESVAYAVGRGWKLRYLGHWGRLFCPCADRDGCQVCVNGTPKNPEAHARQIKRAVDRCPHYEEEADDEAV